MVDSLPPEPPRISAEFRAAKASCEATVQAFRDRCTVQLAERPVRQPSMLIVDDDRQVANAYRRTFEEYADVETVLTGAEALARIPTSRPRVVVVDLRLGDVDQLNGLDVAAAIDGPLLVLTSGYEDQLEAACRRFHVAALLHKPPRAGEVDAVIALLRGPCAAAGAAAGKPDCP